MKHILEYKVLWNIKLDDLMNDVTDHMNESWKCQGGIYVKDEGNFTFYYQAMVKDIIEK